MSLSIRSNGKNVDIYLHNNSTIIITIKEMIGNSRSS